VSSRRMAASAAIEDIAAIPVESIERAIQEQEEEYDEENQLFEEHEVLHKRLGKSLYYGGSDSTSADRLSLPLTELCVDHFNRVMDIEQPELEVRKHQPSSGNDWDDSSDDEDETEDEEEEEEETAKKRRQDERLDMTRAAQVSRETCASPTSLVLALLYLERLRGSNPGYLASVSSADLFLVSLMVASKYLHDDGEEDEVFNEEWATSGGLSRKQLNRLEIEFLTSIDWRLHVTPAEFEKTATSIERAVAQKQLNNRHWEQFTYTDIMVLSKPVKAQAVWDHFAGLAIKLTTVVVAAYAASLVSMMGTCHLLDQVKLGPNAISQSVNTLYASLAASRQAAATDSTNPDQQLSSAANDSCRCCCGSAAGAPDMIFMEQQEEGSSSCGSCGGCANNSINATNGFRLNYDVLPHKGTAPLAAPPPTLPPQRGRRCVPTMTHQYYGDDAWRIKRGFPLEPGNLETLNHHPSLHKTSPLAEDHLPPPLPRFSDEIFFETSWLH